MGLRRVEKEGKSGMIDQQWHYTQCDGRRVLNKMGL
jgi:hypothetical protein